MKKDNIFLLTKKEKKKLKKKLAKRLKKVIRSSYQLTRTIKKLPSPGSVVVHDRIACFAMEEHRDAWKNPFRVGPGPNMYDIARKHGTTVVEMQKHYYCHYER